MGVIYVLTDLFGDLDDYRTYKGLVEFESLVQAQKAYPASEGFDLITFSNMHALNTKQRIMACRAHFQCCSKCSQEMRASIKGREFKWVCPSGHSEPIIKNPPHGRNGGRKPTRYLSKIHER